MNRIFICCVLASLTSTGEAAAEPSATFRCAASDTDKADYPLVVPLRCPANLKLEGTFVLNVEKVAVFDARFRNQIVLAARKASEYTSACYGRERTNLDAFRKCRERVQREQDNQRAFVADVLRRWPHSDVE
jgi:hypothetical protein